MKKGINNDEILLIRATAETVVRQGYRFTEWLKKKKESDPRYCFLFDGNGSDFFRHLIKNNLHDPEESVDAASSRSMSHAGSGPHNK